jgi:uncharacterized protein (DUF58 family)
MIARRTVQLTLLSSILLAIGLGTGLAPAIVWGLSLAGLLTYALTLAPPTGATAHLATDRRHPRTGDIIQITAELEVPHGQGPVTLHIPLPSRLQLVEGNNLHVFWKTHRRLRARISFRVRADSRGPATIRGVRIHTTSPLRLRTGTTATLTPPLEIAIEPRVRSVPRLRHMRGHGITLRPAGDTITLGPRSNDFEEVRAYNQGDPLRNVNWKATARASHDHMQLMVNEFVPEGRKSVWLFLDGGAHMEVGSSQENALDHALEGTLGVISHFLERGYRVGATIYHQAETQVFYPDVGTRQLGRLTRALATLTTQGGGEPLDHAVLATRGFLMRERPLILLVTRPESDPGGTRRGLSQIRSITGHGERSVPILLIAPTPVVHTLQSGHHPITVGVLQTAARSIYQEIRRSGVRVFAWDPARTSLERLIIREVVAK